MRLYHATLLSNLKAIQGEGLRAGSYWTADLDLPDYYIAAVEEEDGQGLEEAAVLTMDLDAMIKIVQGAGKDMLPDRPGIQEPITGALGRSEDDRLCRSGRIFRTLKRTPKKEGHFKSEFAKEVSQGASA